MRTVNGSFSMLSTVEDAYGDNMACSTDSHGTDPVAALGWKGADVGQKPTVPPFQLSFPIERATRPSCSLVERTPSHHAASRLGVVRSHAPGQAEREPRVSLIWERPAAQTESSRLAAYFLDEVYLSTKCKTSKNYRQRTSST